MRHPNADMLITKANNMSLVLLGSAGRDWFEMKSVALPIGGIKYYLCHPKHTSVCLAWLNGQCVRAESASEYRYTDVPPVADPIWSESSIFLDDLRDIVIKPKKEKRWIGVAKNGGVTLHYPSKELVEKVLEYHSLSASYQIIEIEVEV